MKSSRDLVGAEKRELLQQAINEADPFNSSRAEVTNFAIKSVGTPFFVSEVDMAKFVKSAQVRCRTFE